MGCSSGRTTCPQCGGTADSSVRTAQSAGAAADFVLTTDPSDPTKQVHVRRIHAQCSACAYGEATNRIRRIDQVKLCSGDLLIFGGPARLIHHGVTRILIKSTPDFLVLPQPARINLTFRET